MFTGFEGWEARNLFLQNGWIVYLLGSFLYRISKLR